MPLESKVNKILKKADELSDRRLARMMRVSAISSFGIAKVADKDQNGVFQSFQSGELDYLTRENETAQRAGVGVPRDSLYGVGPKHDKADNSLDEPPRSLSTRYSPDRVGVQARRVSDGVFQDPYTNKIYDYNEGYKTESGDIVGGGTIDNQTKILHNS